MELQGTAVVESAALALKATLVFLQPLLRLAAAFPLPGLLARIALEATVGLAGGDQGYGEVLLGLRDVTARQGRQFNFGRA